MHIRDSAIALFALALAATGTGQAWAYDCTGTENGSFTYWTEKAEIRTVVENRTSDKAWEVTIYRNDNEKQRKLLNSENRYTRFTMNIGDMRFADEVSVKVNFRPRYSGGKEINCEYKVKYNLTKEVATWSLLDKADAICDDVTALCEDCALTCENKFITGAKRWTTTLAICDFLDKNCAVVSN